MLSNNFYFVIILLFVTFYSCNDVHNKVFYTSNDLLCPLEYSYIQQVLNDSMNCFTQIYVQQLDFQRNGSFLKLRLDATYEFGIKRELVLVVNQMTNSLDTMRYISWPEFGPVVYTEYEVEYSHIAIDTSDWSDPKFSFQVYGHRKAALTERTIFLFGNSAKSEAKVKKLGHIGW
jgi:hypothetical protein